MKYIVLVTSLLSASISQSFEYSVQLLSNIPNTLFTHYRGITDEGILFGSIGPAVNTDEIFSLNDNILTRFRYPNVNLTNPTSFVSNNLVFGVFGSNDRGFVYQNGVYSELRSIANSERVSPYGANSFGNFCGSVDTSPGALLPYARINGVEHILQTPPLTDEGVLTGINENNMCIGRYSYPGPSPTYFTWSASSGIREFARPLMFYDLNNEDEIVGTLPTLNGYRAVMLKDGAVVDIGPGSAALINNRSEIIIEDPYNANQSYIRANGVTRRLKDLIDPNYSSYDLVRAIDINDRGQILAGLVNIVNGQTGEGITVVLNPVPEPASIVALGLGASFLARRKRQICSDDLLADVA